MGYNKPDLGLDAELDADEDARLAQQEQALLEQQRQNVPHAAAQEVGFSFGSTPQVSMSPHAATAPNAAHRSSHYPPAQTPAPVLSSSRNSTPATLSPVPSSIRDGDKVKRRSSLLGAFGLGKSSKRGPRTPSQLSEMSRITESNDAESTTTPGVSELGTASAPAQTGALGQSSSAPIQVVERASSDQASISSASSAAPPMTSLASSLKSVPPYPACRDALQPFKQRAEFIMKFSSYGFTAKQRQKHGTWKARFILLSAVPAFKAAADVPLGGHHYLLSAFRSNDSADQEVDRVRILPSTVVCVTDELPGGKLHVLKIENTASSTGSSSEPWFFSMNDVSDLTTWLKILKQIIFQLRGIQANEPETQRTRSREALSRASLSDKSSIGSHTPAHGLHTEVNESPEATSSLQASPIIIEHPFSSPKPSQHSGFDGTPPFTSRTSSPAPSTFEEDVSSPRESVSRQGSADLRRSNSTRTSSGQSGRLSENASLSSKGTLSRAQTAASPLPALPSQRYSVHSHSSDETAGSSSLASTSMYNGSGSKRVSASSGGSLTSPASSAAGHNSRHHESGCEPPPTPPQRNALRQSASKSPPPAEMDRFATLPLPLPPASGPTSPDRSPGLSTHFEAPDDESVMNGALSSCRTSNSDLSSKKLASISLLDEVSSYDQQQNELRQIEEMQQRIAHEERRQSEASSVSSGPRIRFQ